MIAYLHCAAIACHFLLIPALLAASEHPFRSTGRLVDKRRSHVLSECVESLTFQKRNK